MDRISILRFDYSGLLKVPTAFTSFKTILMQNWKIRVIFRPQKFILFWYITRFSVFSSAGVTLMSKNLRNSVAYQNKGSRGQFNSRYIKFHIKINIKLNSCHEFFVKICICKTQNRFSTPLIKLRSFAKFVHKHFVYIYCVIWIHLWKNRPLDVLLLTFNLMCTITLLIYLIYKIKKSVHNSLLTANGMNNSN